MWKHLYTMNCPALWATQADLDSVYRLVDSMSIELSDFEPNIVRFPKKPYPDTCVASGTSVFDDYNAVEAIRKKIPAFKNKLIAEGSIAQSDGVIKAESNSHITWWVFINNPQNKFQVIP